MQNAEAHLGAKHFSISMEFSSEALALWRVDNYFFRAICAKHFSISMEFSISQSVQIFCSSFNVLNTFQYQWNSQCRAFVGRHARNLCAKHFSISMEFSKPLYFQLLFFLLRAKHFSISMEFSNPVNSHRAADCRVLNTFQYQWNSQISPVNSFSASTSAKHFSISMEFSII